MQYIKKNTFRILSLPLLTLAVATAAQAKDIPLQDFTVPPEASAWSWIEAKGALRTDGEGWDITFNRHHDTPTNYPTAALRYGRQGGFREPDWSDGDLVLDLHNRTGWVLLSLRIDDAHGGSHTFQFPLEAGERKELRFSADDLRSNNLTTTCISQILLHSYKPEFDQVITIRALKLAKPDNAPPPAFDLQTFDVNPYENQGWDFVGCWAAETGETGEDAGWRITYPKHRAGNVHAYPSAIKTIHPEQAELGDWRQRTLFLDLENPGDFYTLQVRIDSRHGDFRTYSIPLAARERLIHAISTDWILDGGLSSISCISKVFLHTTLPPNDRNVIVRSLRVDSELPPRLLTRERARLERGREVQNSLPARAEYREFLEGYLSDYEAAPALLINGDNGTRLDDRLDHADYYGSFKPQEAFRLIPLANTAKLRPEEMPAKDKIIAAPIEFSAARGEYESFQTLVVAGAKDIENVVAVATPLTNPKGKSIDAEVFRLEYVPVILPTPTPFGFAKRGRYPDPLARNTPFRVPAWTGQSLFWRVKAPADAAPGVYKGELSVTVDGKKQSVPVSLKVFDVDLPVEPRLKTLFVYRSEFAYDRYNGSNWTKEMSVDFVDMCREYRINAESFGSGDIIPWDKVYTSDDEEKISADWTAFDAAVEKWIAKGKNGFLSYFPNWGLLASMKNPEVEAQKYRLLAEHLAEKGWSDRFYIYTFDEPSFDSDQNGPIQEYCEWIHEQGRNLKIVFTSLHSKGHELVGFADIFVPILEAYNQDFGKERIAAGDQYWVYTCISAATTRSPNNWKIDAVGAGQRALGWWLYHFGAQGYLYWGLDYWAANPWTQANTFQDGNGDGYMFYPNPDRKGMPLPSLRMELQRDGFEDFELLHILRERAGPNAPKATLDILDTSDIIAGKHAFVEDDDALYSKRHAQLLEALAGGKGGAATKARTPRTGTPRRTTR